MGFIAEIEGLSRSEIDFLFADSNQWHSDNPDFHDLLKSFHDNVNKDDLADIPQQPTLYSKIVALRHWRYAMLRAGHTWQQLRDWEMEITWPSGFPPLKMPRADNIFSVPFEVKTPQGEREELIEQSKIMLLQDLIAVCGDESFNDAMYKKFCFEGSLIVGYDLYGYAERIEDLCADYLQQCQRDYAYAPLNAMVGMDKLIAEVEQIETLHKRGQSEGIPLNFALSAPQGCGKSVSAAALGKVLYRLGILKSAYFLKKSHQDLNTRGVREKDAQLTALAFNKAIEKSGTLFVDEVNQLDQGEGGPIGVINIQAEDQRGKIALIVATYRDQMEKFLDADSGLRGRFRHIAFDDLRAMQVVQIFEELAGQRGYQIPSNQQGEELRSALWTHFNKQQKDSMTSFENGRGARNLLDKILGTAKFPDAKERLNLFNDLMCTAPILTVEMLEDALQHSTKNATAMAHDPRQEQNPYGKNRVIKTDSKVVTLHQK